MNDTSNPLSAALNLGPDAVHASTIMNIGMQYGKGYISENQTRLTSSILAPLENLRPYFFINDAYVRAKALRIVFPYRADFNRQPADEVAASFDCEDALPVSDASAPDLYIPIMSVVTLAVFQCFYSIIKEPTPPEMVFANISRYCVLWAIETALIKTAVASSAIPISIPWLSAASWCGYIHFPLIAVALIDTILGAAQWRIALAISTFFCASWMFFFYKTLENSFCYTKRSQVSLYALTLLQFILFYWSRARFFGVRLK